MTYHELERTFRELKKSSPREDLTAHIVFTEDSFASPRSLLGRTYRVSSDNKAFRPGMDGGSVFAWCLDPASGQGVRLDRYVLEEEGGGNGWKVQDCYVLERMRDAKAVRGLTRIELEDGTVCYGFGGTCIRVREVTDGGKSRLEPLAGSRMTDGGWTDLPMDRVHGCCTLLGRRVDATRGSGPETTELDAVVLDVDKGLDGAGLIQARWDDFI